MKILFSLYDFIKNSTVPAKIAPEIKFQQIMFAKIAAIIHKKQPLPIFVGG